MCLEVWKKDQHWNFNTYRPYVARNTPIYKILETVRVDARRDENWKWRHKLSDPNSFTLSMTFSDSFSCPLKITLATHILALSLDNVFEDIVP